MGRAPRRSARLQPPKRTMTTRALTRRQAQEQASRAQRMWLDALPLEINSHIALYLNNGKAPDFQDRNFAVLHLANVSKKQREAVLEATSYSFELQYDSSAKWNAVFRDSIRHVNTNNFRGDDFLALLKAPTLETATVSNRSVHLKLIAKVKQLRELTVEFSVRSPAHYLLSTLNALDLRKLSFNCSWFHSRGVCVFNLFPTCLDCIELSSLCPTVSEMEFNCDCSGKNHDLARFVDAFPQLRKLTLNVEVSEYVIERLRSFDSVTLKTSPHRGGLHHPAQFKLATKIGNVVTGIVTSSHFDGAWWVPRDPVIDAAGVAELTKCPRLTNLDMYIEKRAERGLPELTELRSLRLQWDPSDMYEWIGPEPVSQHYAPSPEFFRRIVGSAPGLEELCLFRASISIADLDLMLKTLGKGLKVFGTSIEGQSEHAGDRLLSLINMVVRYNPNLRRLSVFYHDAGVERVVESGTMPSKREILLAARHLQRGCPQLDIKKLFAWLGDWLDENPRALYKSSEGL